MSTTEFNYKFDSGAYQDEVKFPTGIFINGKFSAGIQGTTIDVINPTNGKVVTSVAEGTPADIDHAVKAAKAAFHNSWGLNVPGAERGRFLNKLADLMEKHSDELAAVEALNGGKTFDGAKKMDLRLSISTIRYYAGWADKIHGQVIETQENMLAYTRHEPFGVVGQILSWNFPLLMMCWKLGPALATGNCVVLKPSELTPLTALRMCSLINEAGFPPGVVNVVTGYGNVAGHAIATHMDIDKITFTGSTAVGRRIMELAANSNLKNVTLELGGRSPNIVFADANLDLAVSCFANGIFLNHGQTCCSGSRIFVHSSIYDKFLERFTQETKSLKFGDLFALDSKQGAQVSKVHFDRIMEEISQAKSEGAKVHLGGERYGTQGFWIQPTIITDTRPHMKIVKGEAFGPIAIVIKFTDEKEVLDAEKTSMQGLTASFFTKNLTHGVEVANKLQAGTVWVNCMNTLYPNVPFGGYKQSGIGRECGQYALDTYTNVKSVQINLTDEAPVA